MKVKTLQPGTFLRCFDSERKHTWTAVIEKVRPGVYEIKDSAGRRATLGHLAVKIALDVGTMKTGRG